MILPFVVDHTGLQFCRNLGTFTLWTFSAGMQMFSSSCSVCLMFFFFLSHYFQTKSKIIKTNLKAINVNKFDLEFEVSSVLFTSCYSVCSCLSSYTPVRKAANSKTFGFLAQLKYTSYPCQTVHVSFSHKCSKPELHSTH